MVLLSPTLRPNTYQSNCNRNNRPKQVDQHGQCAAALECNLQELKRVEAPSATLTIGVDTLSNLVAIVIVLRQCLRTTIPSTVRRVLS